MALQHGGNRFLDSMAAEQQEHDGVLPKRRLFEARHADLEITPMIDITFLLLIFFLVASHPDSQTAVDLPPARYGQGVSARSSTIITVAAPQGRGGAKVYLNDGKIGEPLPDDPEIRRREIRDYVDAGLQAGRNDVLIKAERKVLHRQVSEVATAAASVEGVQLYMAVLEEP